jgi:5'-3' exoribonuclease 2
MASDGLPHQVRIATLREYLAHEMRDADWSGVRGGFDLERAIDDFIFLCFFVGNDFLPPCPGLEIREGALEAMLLL